MPRPREGESESDYVARCIPVVLDEGTAKDQDQAAAICHSMWRDGKMMTTADRKTLLKAIRTRKGSGGFGYGITTADRYVAPTIDAIGKGLALRAFHTVGAGGFEGLLKRAGETLTICLPDTVNEKRASGVAEMKSLLGVDPPAHAMIAMINRLTTPKEDRDGDTLQTAGARLDPKAPLLWQHVHTLPIGKMMRIIKQDEEMLKVATVLLDINELTSDAAKLIEAEALRFSHGFIPLKFEERKGGPLARFNIIELDIVEESLVSVPSNTDAEIEQFSRGKLASDVFKAHAKALFDARTKQSPGFTLAKDASPKSKASPVLRKMFDIATQRVEPSSMECDWAARFIGCSVKDLHVHSTQAGGLYQGALLEGFEQYSLPDKCLDQRNIGNQCESPPVFETVDLNSKLRKNFLIEGIRFYASEHGHKYVVRTWQGFGSQYFMVYADSAEKAQEPIDSAWQFVNDLNPLKGEAFALTGGFIPRGDTKWADVFLDEPTEKSLKRTVRIINEKGSEAANRGVLMAGPPGTGKTLSARVMMNEADATFIWVSPKDFYRGGGFVEAFQLARALAPSILMFEDIDNWMTDYTIDLFKTEMDGLHKSSGVVTILTTNFPDRLPSALVDRPGRFHDVLELHLPSKDVRVRMLKAWAGDATLDALSKMADDTDGYSGAHLYELCHFAKVVRDEDGCSLDDALTKAFGKVKEQRELISQGQLAGSSYRPGRREFERALQKGFIMEKTNHDGGITSGAVGPTPNTGEDQAAFIERCCLDSMMVDNYPTYSDREAACRIQWGKGAKPETKKPEMAMCKGCGEEMPKAKLDADGYCPECAKKKSAKAVGTCKECGQKNVQLNDDGLCKHCAEKPKIGNDSMPVAEKPKREAQPETKAGRILSRKNENTLRDAIDDLENHDKMMDVPKAAKLLAREAKGKVKGVVDQVGGDNPIQEMSVDHVLAGAIQAAAEDRSVRDRLRKALDALDGADELEQVRLGFRAVMRSG